MHLTEQGIAVTVATAASSARARPAVGVPDVDTHVNAASSIRNGQRAASAMRRPEREEMEDVTAAKFKPSQQPSARTDARLHVAPTAADSVREVVRSPGTPLDQGSRSFMESRFGHDFSHVRVHADARGATSAQAVRADAYTVGAHIAFAAGRYAPETCGGRRLLAHELTHVIQQSSAPVDGSETPCGGIQLSDPSDRFEQQAELTAERVVAGRSIAHGTGVGPSTSQGPSSALRVQRAFGFPTWSVPTPPAWLGSYGAGAVHVKGGIWDVKLPSLGGDTWAGPYGELTRYIRAQGYSGQLEAAHIVGGEHLEDIYSGFSYDAAPCIAVDKSLHATWTKQTTDLQVGTLGGRATKTAGRAVPTRREVIGLYDEVYRAHPELREMVRDIVKLPGRVPPGHLMPVSTKMEPVTEAPSASEIEATQEIEREVVRTEGATGEVARLVSKLGTAVRVTGFLLEVIGPWLEVILDFFGRLAFAKEELRHESYGLGFAEGMAASLLGFTAEEATNMLLYPDPSRGSIGEQVAGFAGVRHEATQKGRSDGWKFAGKLRDQERREFIKEGFTRIRGRGHTIGPKFNFDDVVELGVVLKAINDELAEAAQREADWKAFAHAQSVYETGLGRGFGH
jgi:hypothetical protein